ncbi:serine hydrolase domain-containing protein [Ningiella sp. W23]|uniref:serine hydrolase domain-containing protein n=1 Tax=Ningiella sp. W23 TaxID=3023715 RepID=UPI003757D668
MKLQLCTLAIVFAFTLVPFGSESLAAELDEPSMLGPWMLASAKQDGEVKALDNDKLLYALDYIKKNAGSDGISQTLIIKDDEVVYAGEEVHKVHNVYSVTKSFVSTALGLLIEDGKTTLDTKICSIDKQYCDHYSHVTLKHLTTMTSGYNAAGENRWNEDSEDWSKTPFLQASPLFVPGSAYAYWDEAMIILGAVLTKIAGESLYDYLDSRLMKPMGVNEWAWWHESDAISGFDMNYAPGGIELSAVSLAKYGMLMLNEGHYPYQNTMIDDKSDDGKQLLSKDWIEQATRNQVSLQIPVAETDRKSIDGVGYYGFNWWVNGQNRDGQWQMPDAPKGMFYARGFNNNMLFVIPQWNMVVVRMGEDDEKRIDKVAFYNAFFKRLSSAMNLRQQQK